VRILNVTARILDVIAGKTKYFSMNADEIFRNL
jgi:hypothetical protein